MYHGLAAERSAALDTTPHGHVGNVAAMRGPHPDGLSHAARAPRNSVDLMCSSFILTLFFRERNMKLYISVKTGGERLNFRDLRTRRGMSQEYVAAKLDMSQTTVSFWERGLSQPYRKVRPRLASLLGVSVEDLDAALEQTRRERPNAKR